MFGSNSLKSLDNRLKAVEASVSSHSKGLPALDQRISRAITAADTAKAGLDQLRADVRSMNGIEIISARLDDLARDFAEVRSRQIEAAGVLAALQTRVTHIEGADDDVGPTSSAQAETATSAALSGTAPSDPADVAGDATFDAGQVETTGFVEVGSVVTIPPEDGRFIPPHSDERAA